MKTITNFVILLVLLICVNARPQWRPTNLDSFVPNQEFRISKTYDFNKGRSSATGSFGFNRNNGFGVGVGGSHNFGQGSTAYGSIFKSQRGGTNRNIGLSHQFNSGTSIFGERAGFRGGNSNTFGISQKIGSGTSLFGSKTKSNFGGFKVNQHNIGLSHKFKNGGVLSGGFGRNSHTGNQYGLSFKFPFGK